MRSEGCELSFSLSMGKRWINTLIKDMTNFYIAIPDTKGKYCYFTGCSWGDPARSYLKKYARVYYTERAAKIAIAFAKKTHPFREREYIIIKEEILQQ
jgi:hypothetical protein